MQNKTIGWIGLGTILTTSLIFWGISKKHACWQEAEDTLAFDVTMNEQSHPDLDIIRKEQATAFQGDLYLRAIPHSIVSRFSQTPLRIQGRFRPKAFQTDDKKFVKFRDFQRPFFLNLNASCELESIDFDGQETFSARQTVFRLLRILNIPKTGFYQDFLGTSELTKTVLGPTETFARTKVVKPTQAAQLKDHIRLAGIEESRFDFVLDDKSWPISVEVREHLKLQIGAEKISQALSYQISMQRLSVLDADAFEGLGAIDPHFLVTKSPTDYLKGRDRSSVYTASNDAKVSGDFSASITDFRQLLNTDPVKAKVNLIAFLRQSPSSVNEIESEIKAMNFNDTELVHLLFVFAKLDRPEGQEALKNLIEDQDLSPSVRIRALFAIGEVTLPSEALIQAVRKESEVLTGVEGNLSDMGATALLASGIMARNLNDVAPQSHAEIVRDIQNMYQSSTAETLRSLAIDAMGNTEDDVFFEPIKAVLKEGSEGERHAAINAIAKVQGDDRDGLLASLLIAEKSPNNRISAFKSLQSIGIRSAETLGRVGAHLKVETDPGVRTAAMHALGLSIPMLPETKKVLIDQAKGETNPDVLQAAGRYLSAYEMKN